MSAFIGAPLDSSHKRSGQRCGRKPTENRQGSRSVHCQIVMRVCVRGLLLIKVKKTDVDRNYLCFELFQESIFHHQYNCKPSAPARITCFYLEASKILCLHHRRHILEFEHLLVIFVYTEQSRLPVSFFPLTCVHIQM